MADRRGGVRGWIGALRRGPQVAAGPADGIGGRRAPTPLSAGGWSIGSYVLSQGIGSLLYLPLARLLQPSDFGLFAEAMLVYGALNLISDLSLARALIRLPGDRAALAQATAWLSLIIGGIGALLCILAGPPLAAIFDEPRLRPIMIMLAPGVLATALGAVPFALLARELDFRRRTVPESVSVGVGGVAALGAALLGAGVYSLVVYSVVRTALAAAIGWRVIDWRPSRARPERAAVRRILAFGLPAGGGDLALYARLNVDTAITGRRLGADALGVYTLAWNAAASPALLINAAFGGAGYATYSRLQGDRDRLRAVYLSVTRLIATIALPLFVSAVFLRAEIVAVLYGERWAGMVAPLLALLLLQGVREICRPGAGMTLALGHSRIYALCGVVMLPLTVVAILVGSRWGVPGVAWAMLIAVGGASLVWPALAITFLRPRAGDLVRALALPLLLVAVTAPAVALSRWLLAEAGWPSALRLAVAILVGGTVFLAAVRLSWRSLRVDIDRLREALPEGSGLVEGGRDGTVAEEVALTPGGPARTAGPSPNPGRGAPSAAELDSSDPSASIVGWPDPAIQGAPRPMLGEGPGVRAGPSLRTLADE